MFTPEYQNVPILMAANMFHYGWLKPATTQCHPPGNKALLVVNNPLVRPYFLGQGSGIGGIPRSLLLAVALLVFSARLRTVSVREASRNATGVAEVVGQHIVNQLATRQALARKVRGEDTNFLEEAIER